MPKHKTNDHMEASDAILKLLQVMDKCLAVPKQAFDHLIPGQLDPSTQTALSKLITDAVSPPSVHSETNEASHMCDGLAMALGVIIQGQGIQGGHMMDSQWKSASRVAFDTLAKNDESFEKMCKRIKKTVKVVKGECKGAHGTLFPLNGEMAGHWQNVFPMPAI